MRCVHLFLYAVVTLTFLVLHVLRIRIIDYDFVFVFNQGCNSLSQTSHCYKVYSHVPNTTLTNASIWSHTKICFYFISRGEGDRPRLCMKDVLEFNFHCWQQRHWQHHLPREISTFRTFECEKDHWLCIGLIATLKNINYRLLKHEFGMLLLRWHVNPRIEISLYPCSGTVSSLLLLVLVNCPSCT